MNDENKTKTQLISELAQLREKVAELESTEDKYRNLFENSPIGIFQSTPAGQCRLINPAFAHMTGFASPEEMINEVKDMSTIYDDPADREEVKRLFAKQGEINEHIIRQKRRDGQTRWMSIYGKAVYNDVGEIDYYDGFTLDITERKQIEKALVNSEILHRKVLESISDAVYITDKTGKFTFICNNVDVIFGYSQEEIQALKNIKQLLGEKFVDYQKLKQVGEIANIEHTVLDKVGIEHHLLINVKYVEIDQGRMLFGCRDITERKLAKDALIAHEQQLDAIFENSLNAVMVADDLGNYISVNPAAADMFGYAIEQLLTMNVGDLRTKIMPDAAKRYQEYLKKGKEIGEFEFIRADNQPRIAQYHAVRVRENFNLSILSDITEQMQVEQALKETNRFNQHITNTVPILVYVFDLIKGHNIYINREAERFLGVSLSDLQTKGQPFFEERIHPDDLDKIDEFNTQWTEAGDEQVFQKEYR